MTASRRDGLLLLAVLALGAGLFLTAAAARLFVGPDEPRYASIARELAASDDLVVLTLDGKLYREKPPLWYWAAAASGTLLGEFTDFTVRLPSAIAAVMLMLVIARLGARVLGDLRVGLLAAGLYALTVQGLNIGHRAYLDTLLTLFTTASALVFLGGLVAGKAGFRAHVLGWAFLGLAVLVKGPPALLPPLLAVAGFAIVRRDAGAFRRIAPLPGVGVMLALVAVWFLPWALSVGWEEVALIWKLQIAGRATSSHAHAKPFWFYLQHFPAQFLPAALAIPTLVIAWIRRPETRTPERRMLLAWFALGFLVFSIFSGKRNLYLLPLYPAACLLVASHLSETSRRRRIATMGVLALLVLAIPAAAILGPVSDDRRSARGLAAAAERHLTPEDTPVRYRTANRSLPWYTNRRWRWAGGDEEEAFARVAKLREDGPVVLAGEKERVGRVPDVEILETVLYDGETWAIGRAPRAAR